MARNFAKIQTAIWTDDDFLDLTLTEQWLYLHIVTHDDLTFAGSMDWRPKKVVPMAHGLTLGEVADAAEVLRAKRYFIIDDDTEEVLVRTYVRNDELLRQPNMGIPVGKAYRSMSSRVLRGVFIHELQRLHAKNPDWKSWAHLTEELQKKAIDPWEGYEVPTLKLPEASLAKGICLGIGEPVEEPPF